jgi:hypothetical protein
MLKVKVNYKRHRSYQKTRTANALDPNRPEKNTML